MFQGRRTPDHVERATGVQFWPKGLRWFEISDGFGGYFFLIKSKGRTGAADRSKLLGLSGKRIAGLEA